MEIYNKKSIWKWILLYAIIAAVAYGGVYYFFSYKNGGDGDNSQTATQSNSETADWKTYRNDEYGFEMQIPADWIVGQTTGSTFEFTTQDLEDAQLENMENCKDIKTDGSCITEFRGSIGRFQYFGRIVDLKGAFTVSKVDLNQMLWTRYEMPSIDFSVNYAITKNNSSYNFEIYNPRDEDSLVKLLSTFKFTK